MFYSDFVDIITEYEQSRNNFSFSEINFKMEMANENSHDEWTVEYNNNNNNNNNRDPNNNLPTQCSPDNRTRSPGRENRNFTVPVGEPQKSSPSGVDVTTCDETRRSPKILENGEITSVYPSSPSTSAPGERNVRKRSNDGDENNIDILQNHDSGGVKFKSPRQTHAKYMGGAGLSHSQQQENIIRKHGNSYVSIMGHHYPPPKRVRHTPNNPMTPQGPPTYHHPNDMQPMPRQQPRGGSGQVEFHKEYFPTMAMKGGPGCHDGPGPRDDPGYGGPQHIYAKQQNEKGSHLVAISNNATNFGGDKSVVKPLHGTTRLSPPTGGDLDKNNDDHGRFHSLQERQMEVFNDMLGRHEQFLMQLLTQQREAAEAAQERDRQFMFKLVEIFVKQK